MAVAPTGTYTDIAWPSGDHDRYVWRLRPLLDPTPDGYFWAHQFGWRDGGPAGYVGLQTLGSGLAGKCAVFSIGAGAIAVAARASSSAAAKGPSGGDTNPG